MSRRIFDRVPQGQRLRARWFGSFGARTIRPWWLPGEPR